MENTTTETKPAIQSAELWTGVANIINILIMLVEGLQANPETSALIGQTILSLVLVVLQVVLRYARTRTKISGFLKAPKTTFKPPNIAQGKEKFHPPRTSFDDELEQADDNYADYEKRFGKPPDVDMY